MANRFEMEQRNKLALEAAELGVWTWDTATDLFDWDEQAAKTWGLRAGTRPTMAALDTLIHPDDLAAKREALRRALEPHGGGMYRAEYRIQPADGPPDGTWERRVVSLGKTEFADDSPVRVIGIVRDVTKSRIAEDAIRRSEARLAGILSIAADAIISIDEQQRIILFNHGAETTFGYSASDVIGRDLDMLLPVRFRATHGGHIRQFAASGTSARHMGERREIFGLRKNGQEFPAEASISKLDIGGECTFTVVLRDISARKHIERALERSNLELEARVAERTSALEAETERLLETQAALSRAQRMEAFGQLAGGIAHDFNNLLTVITGNQELLEMRLQDPKQLALLKRSQEAAEMGARLTARLLTFARRRQLEPTLLNLNDQITGMVELLRRAIGEHVTLTTNLAPRLWAVRADASEIENAVLNLAINACDAMPNGGKLTIETADCSIDHAEIGRESKLPAGDYVRISVSDTGTGMSPDVLGRAFEPFFTTKPPGKGTGLGLSTIDGFVQQSGGTVTAYSDVGHGTIFNLYLPRAAGGSPPAVAAQPGETARSAKGETVLVVEDNAEVREVAVKRLEELGYATLEADDGPSAIALLQASGSQGSGPQESGTQESGRRIDLVFSDVVMPGGMSGFDLTQWVATHFPTLKMLLTSGYPDEMAGARNANWPAVKLLRKPYTRNELAHALRDVLDG